MNVFIICTLLILNCILLRIIWIYTIYNIVQRNAHIIWFSFSLLILSVPDVLGFYYLFVFSVPVRLMEVCRGNIILYYITIFEFGIAQGRDALEPWCPLVHEVKKLWINKNERLFLIIFRYLHGCLSKRRRFSRQARHHTHKYW